MTADYPILEFDPERRAVIEPADLHQPIDIPERCVLPFYHSVIESFRADGLVAHVRDLLTCMGPMPVYRMEHEGTPLAVAHPGLGAPLSAGLLEELIALGCRTFIACGAAGVLDKNLVRGTVVVPDAAVRDEGTSYHYAPPAREIQVAPEIVAAIEETIKRHNIAYRVGKTWTTDAFFRETRGRVARRKAEGCLTVEMECSALLAVAQFRGVKLGQILATGDDVSGDVWDPRKIEGHDSFPEKIFWLAAEACAKL